MQSRIKKSNGFSLIELCVVIVVIGIMTGLAMQSMTVMVDDVRRVQTEREMDELAKAIVGDPVTLQEGVRSDFGFVGDVGAFPSSLTDLYTNPGNLPTWNGPYLNATYLQDTVSYKKDEWGTAYSYSGGLTLSSSGGGSTLTKKLAADAGEYLRNKLYGTIKDNDGAPPDSIKKDSIKILIDMPNGVSGNITKSYKPNSTGNYMLDSIPAGQRLVRFIYTPANDTVRRYTTIYPRHKSTSTLDVEFAAAYFSDTGISAPPCTPDTITLRPNGNGGITDIDASSGCTNHYDCVDESVADDNTTKLDQAGGYETDVFALEDPVVNSCTIAFVKVYARAIRDHTQGDIMMAVYVSGTSYTGTNASLTTSWATYSHTWTTNPATSTAWTWAAITNLQAGIRIKGQSSTHKAHCTQVWVEVGYQ